MDLRQLRYFTAIVECGSISRASSHLNIAQPALSLHIRNMEAELQTPLLFRMAHGVLPTEAGTILLRNARIIIDQFEQAQKEIRGAISEPSGEVRLGMPGTMGQVLGVPLIRATMESLPKVRLRIAEAMSGFVLEWLRLGRVDLGLLYQHFEDRSLRSVGLMSEALVLLGPPDDNPAYGLPAAARALPFAAAAHLPLIVPSPGHGLRTLLAEQAAATGIRITTRIEADSYAVIKALVEQGFGYSILPAHAVQKEVGEGRLRAWPFDPPVLRTVYLVQPTDRPQSHAVHAVDALCRATVGDLAKSVPGWLELR